MIKSVLTILKLTIFFLSQQNTKVVVVNRKIIYFGTGLGPVRLVFDRQMLDPHRFWSAFLRTQ